MNLFVANISRVVKEDALKLLFSEFGDVVSVKIVIDKESGRSKGFGFVDMANDTQALKAIENLRNVDFLDSD